MAADNQGHVTMSCQVFMTRDGDTTSVTVTVSAAKAEDALAQLKKACAVIQDDFKASFSGGGGGPG